MVSADRKELEDLGSKAKLKRIKKPKIIKIKKLQQKKTIRKKVRVNIKSWPK